FFPGAEPSAVPSEIAPVLERGAELCAVNVQTTTATTVHETSGGSTMRSGQQGMAPSQLISPGVQLMNSDLSSCFPRDSPWGVCTSSNLQGPPSTSSVEKAIPGERSPSDITSIIAHLRNLATETSNNCARADLEKTGSGRETETAGSEPGTAASIKESNTPPTWGSSSEREEPPDTPLRSPEVTLVKAEADEGVECYPQAVDCSTQCREETIKPIRITLEKYLAHDDPSGSLPHPGKVLWKKKEQEEGDNATCNGDTETSVKEAEGQKTGVNVCHLTPESGTNQAHRNCIPQPLSSAPVTSNPSKGPVEAPEPEEATSSTTAVTKCEVTDPPDGSYLDTDFSSVFSSLEKTSSDDPLQRTPR
ncbi:hypothetical protein AB205_0036290, partial [Aquarana catesbeiana]